MTPNVCVCLAYTSTTKVVKNSRGCKSLIGKLLNILSRLARGKLACGDAYSEGSPPAKACTEEHEPYKRLHHSGKQSHHCEAPKQQDYGVDTAAIGGKRKCLPREVSVAYVSIREKSAEVIVPWATSCHRKQRPHKAGRTERLVVPDFPRTGIAIAWIRGNRNRI
jgi:hypothetical protein